MQHFTADRTDLAELAGRVLDEDPDPRALLDQRRGADERELDCIHAGVELPGILSQRSGRRRPRISSSDSEVQRSYVCDISGRPASRIDAGNFLMARRAWPESEVLTMSLDLTAAVCFGEP